VVLMELALQLHLKGMVLDLHWVPREQNVEADELSNGIFRQFSADKQIAVDIAGLNFLILPALMVEAESFYGELLSKKRLKIEERVKLKSRREVTEAASIAATTPKGTATGEETRGGYMGFPHCRVPIKIENMSEETRGGYMGYPHRGVPPEIANPKEDARGGYMGFPHRGVTSDVKGTIEQALPSPPDSAKDRASIAITAQDVGAVKGVVPGSKEPRSRVTALKAKCNERGVESRRIS
jgi:hypothetical protein